MKKWMFLLITLIICAFLIAGCVATAIPSSTTPAAAQVNPVSSTPAATAPAPASTNPPPTAFFTSAPPAVTAASSVISATAVVSPAATGNISLPTPALAGQSVEICLNSRQSTGSLTGALSVQQLSNILWAAGKAPLLGTTRKITVAAQAGVTGLENGGTYSYDPITHSLARVSSTLSNQSTLKVSWEIGQDGLAFDAGLIYMPSILAAVSSWGGSPVVSAWPKQLDILFGSDSSLKLNPECVARSSVPQGQTGWLPDPSTTGTDKIGDVLANLKYTSSFGQSNLTLQQVSQLLWAGYGCTPHKDARGVTTPSAMGQLYYTGTIYLLNENGVFRYHNRQPSDNFFVNPAQRTGYFNTRDHRLEQLGTVDYRASLKSAVSGLPQSPCYIILSLDEARTRTAGERQYASLESGFIASNYLLQATALGLGCNFKAQLTAAEQSSVQSITGIPASHKPQVIVSTGNLAK